MEFGMTSYLWKADPMIWGDKQSSDAERFDALGRYICDPKKYVYWATPIGPNDLKDQAEREAIEKCDKAYIWRCKSIIGKNGIVAVGVVDDLPKEYTPASKYTFIHPCRLDDPDWDEKNATDKYKTGIRIISADYWYDPLKPPGLSPRPGTVRKLDGPEEKLINQEICRRAGTK
jgi:hypothetical protein